MLTTLALGACVAGRDARPEDLRGAALPTALAKPAFTFTATDGSAYDFRARTRGKLALVFFGYTHCPDVCPVTMANLGAVVQNLLPSEQEKITVVFVTTDPARDSLTRLRSWLANFDPDFVGLRAPLDSVNAVQAALHLPPTMVGEPDSTGAYEVGHSAVVVAFTPDDSARFVYPFGIRQADWAHDLPKLLAW